MFSDAKCSRRCNVRCRVRVGFWCKYHFKKRGYGAEKNRIKTTVHVLALIYTLKLLESTILIG